MSESASRSGEFSCAVTGFAGLEAEILRLRNTNRESAETAQYLAWRYRTEADAPQPCVYWLLDPHRQRVGMAAAIFRPYWIDGTRAHAAVVGDISVVARLRGRGLGRLLLRCMTTHLEEYFPQHPALVIPTDSARRTLASIGWATVGALSPLVYVLDPSHYIKKLVRSTMVASAAARSVRAGARVIARHQVPPGAALHLSTAPDQALRDFAQRLQPLAGAVRDLGPQTLEWRYAQHPHLRFTFATYTRTGNVRGFLVFEDSTLAATCSVYDLVGATAADVRAMLALFVLRGLSAPGLVSIRVLLDERHPSRTQLRSLGFIARPDDAVFQVHSRDGSAERAAWRLSQGDKDI